MPKGGKYYDDEDLDYEEDDDYYDDDEYEEYDVKPVAKAPPKPAAAPHSQMGKALAQPPKAAPKPGAQIAQAKLQDKFPVAPQPKPGAFAGPSPDDAVRAAQSGAKGLAGAPGPSSSSAAALSRDLEARARVSEASVAGPSYRPFSEYRMDDEVAVECAIAASGEDQDAGGK